MGFDIEGARKAGYSEAEIANHLAQSSGFDAEGARKAGYSDADILKHLAGPGPSMGERVVQGAKDAGSAVVEGAQTASNYRDTQFAKAMGGVAGIPRMASDALNWVGKKTGLPVQAFPVIGPAASLGSSMLPTGEEASKFMVDRASAVPGFKETSINPVVDAGVQALFSGPVLGAGGKMGPLVNAGAAMGSEGAGQAFEGSPLEPYARVAGGVVGGMTPYAIEKGGKAAMSLIEPFTKGGREKIVAKTLVDQATDAPGAIKRMDAYSPPVPGFEIAAGKASRDPGLMAVQEVAEAKVPAMRVVYDRNNDTLTKALAALDEGGDPKAFVAALGKQDAQAAEAAKAAIDALPKGADAATAGQAIRDALRGRYDSLVTARRTATEPLYEAAKKDPTKVKPFPLMMSTADAVKSSKGELKTTAEGVRKLLFDANGKPDRSAGGMMATRDAINDMLSTATPKQKDMLMRFRDEVDTALEAVPPERLARQTYAEMSRPLDVFSADKGAPFAANVIEKDQFGKTFMLPTERVPSQFFRSGDAGAATMKEFLAANNGNARAVDAMRSFVADKARSAKDVKTFLQQNRPAIEALDPALARQLESASATRSISQGYQASPAGKFLSGDLDAAVRSTLGAPDSARRLQALRMSVGGDEAAVAGLRKAIIDDFQRAATGSAEDAARNARLTPAGASNWLKANSGPASNVLSPDQIKGLETITAALKDQSATIPGRAGSPTFDRLATESILGALLSPRFADAPILHPVRKALGLAYGGANEATMNRLFEVIQNPKVAAALMKKANAGNVQMAEPILQQLAKGVAVSQSVGSRE